jgi:broad specificity phosphatase PhoE
MQAATTHSPSAAADGPAASPSATAGSAAVVSGALSMNAAEPTPVPPPPSASASESASSAAGTKRQRHQNIFIVRHGDRQDKLDPTWRGSVPQHLREDTPLSAMGCQQALDVANNLRDHQGGIRHIIASPFLRTIETALPLVKATGLQLKLEDAVWEALCHNPPPDHHANRSFAHLIDRDYESLFTPTTRETRPSSLLRCARTARLLAERFPIDGGDVVIFTHCDPAIYLVATLCGLRVEQVPPVPPCAIFQLRRSPDPARPQNALADRFDLVRNADISHQRAFGPTGPGHPHFPVQCDWMNMLAQAEGEVVGDWPPPANATRLLQRRWAERYHPTAHRDGPYGEWPNCPH